MSNRIGIGDLNAVDVHSNSITVNSSMEKAEVLRNFFSVYLQSRRETLWLFHPA